MLEEVRETHFKCISQNINNNNPLLKEAHGRPMEL